MRTCLIFVSYVDRLDMVKMIARGECEPCGETFQCVATSFSTKKGCRRKIQILPTNRRVLGALNFSRAQREKVLVAIGSSSSKNNTSTRYECKCKC
jgi:hypothetical protein